MKKIKMILLAATLICAASSLAGCDAYIRPAGWGPGPYYYHPWATRHCWVTPWGAWRCGWW